MSTSLDPSISLRLPQLPRTTLKSSWEKNVKLVNRIAKKFTKEMHKRHVENEDFFSSNNRWKIWAHLLKKAIKLFPKNMTKWNSRVFSLSILLFFFLFFTCFKAAHSRDLRAHWKQVLTFAWLYENKIQMLLYGTWWWAKYRESSTDKSCQQFIANLKREEFSL